MLTVIVEALIRKALALTKDVPLEVMFNTSLAKLAAVIWNPADAPERKVTVGALKVIPASRPATPNPVSGPNKRSLPEVGAMEPTQFPPSWNEPVPADPFHVKGAEETGKQRATSTPQIARLLSRERLWDFIINRLVVCDNYSV
jgi:hypothetical protein